MEPVDVHRSNARASSGCSASHAHLLAVGRHAGRRPRSRTGPRWPRSGARPPRCSPPAGAGPTPSPRVRLVEVVEVDDEVALGRGVEAEVAQVGVAADHRPDAGGRQVRRDPRPSPRRSPAGTRTARPTIRPTRTGTSESTRPSCESMICCTTSGRPGQGAQSPTPSVAPPGAAPSQGVPLGAWRRSPPQRGVRLCIGGGEHHMTAGRHRHVIHRWIVPHQCAGGVRTAAPGGWSAHRLGEEEHHRGADDASKGGPRRARPRASEAAPAIARRPSSLGSGQGGDQVGNGDQRARCRRAPPRARASAPRTPAARA